MSKSGTSERSANTKPDSRWWEAYLVRYLVGTPVGVVCLLAILDVVLAQHPFYLQLVSGLRGERLDAKMSIDSTVLVCMGIFAFAYCYVASSPITTYHATRMYRQSWFNRFSRFVWLSVWVMLLYLIVAGGTTWTFTVVLAVPAGWAVVVQLLCVMRLHADGSRAAQSFPGRIYWDCCAALSGKSWPQWLRTAKRPDELEFVAFYQKLSKARTLKARSELRESYTHLREHSNAFFIVLLEISLAALIVCVVQLAGGSVAMKFTIALSVLFLWMLPSVFLWTQANRLERSLIED